ncbi:4-coumarate:CoA ligase 3 [Hibiscus syriacus]|uniref:4-coumarate:CoA ligase 3 n=1 Tax=Hibiscus syriacus TaxID=106335 RepID=A0A6A3AYH7_HIBSY|nr:4-coumarate:CoA ligase 3 [Hibiscus syriacus]
MKQNLLKKLIGALLIDRANAEREKWVAAININFDHIGAVTSKDSPSVMEGKGGRWLASHFDRSKQAGYGCWGGRLLLLQDCTPPDREGARVIWGYVDRILGEPTLIRESSRGKYPWSNMFTRSMSTLSRSGNKAVTKIHQLFDWAKKSKRGLLLFIDEADAFLCEWNKTYMREAQRSALNALLFRTGDQSKDIVLALATNRPGDLDSAVADRIDEVLEFPLPGEDERFKLVKLYLDKYIAQAGSRKPAKTEGFSGREIAKLMASVQAAVYGSEHSVLDPTLYS